MPDFDAIRFLEDHFPDRAVLRETLRMQGLTPPSFEAMRKWTQRGRIPAEWLTLLLAVIEGKRGDAVSLAPYMGDKECDSRPSKARSKPTGSLAGIFD